MPKLPGRPNLSAIDALLRPQSVAVIGASTNEHKVGGVPVALLTKLGFAGRVIPVHPDAPAIQGLPAVKSILDAATRNAGQAVDLAIVAVPATHSERVLRECAEAGVKGLVMFTSGFAEVGGDGVVQQERLATIARDAGMTLLGPNCLGLMNLRARLFATFSPAPMAGVPPLGKIGMVSQSGAFGAYAFSMARKAALGMSHWVTTGNEAGVQAADVIEWFAHDDDTQVIMAYLEGCRDGARLRRALLAARAAHKPVVVVKVGRTAAGARAAMSHTAALAGEDTVYDAVFEECGAIRAFTMEEFFRHGQSFATAAPLHLPKNDAVAIVTLSGGVGTLMADRAEELGLDMPAFTDAEAAPLKAAVPFCSTGNPIDVTGQVIGAPEVLPTACAAAVAGGRYGSVALFTAAGAVSPVFWPSMRRCAELISGQPNIAAAVSGIVNDEQRRTLMELGCLVFEEPTHVIEALAVLRRYVRILAAPSDPPPDSRRIALDDVKAGALNEAEALALLARAGVQAAPHGIAANADEAAAIAERLAAPVAVKLLSRDVLHKSDIGGVILNVRGADAARSAFETIAANARRMAPGAAFEGVIVSRMVKPVLECMAGARLDPVFGPVVAFGLGGTEVEWLNRVAVASAPVTPARALQLLERLDIPRRLDGWRGGPRIKADALVEAICGVGALAAAAGARLVNLEVNPLMVTTEGVFAADAVVQLGTQSDP